MNKVIVLGKNGMLGNVVFDMMRSKSFFVSATTRNELDAQKCSEKDIEEVIAGFNYVINCIGIIKPYIHDNNPLEVQRAIEVNSLFPHRLANAAEGAGAKIIQIATDCVYDGRKGLYTESEEHNAIDVYGKTKSLGEVVAPNVLNLRCSIIGKEKQGYLSLMEWFLKQPKDAQVKGYNNHLWNGVTTKVFAKICIGLIEQGEWFAGTQHVVPADILPKAEILKIFAEVFARSDIKITSVEAIDSVDRTLSTENKSLNRLLWNIAGYDQAPTIMQMISEK